MLWLLCGVGRAYAEEQAILGALELEDLEEVGEQSGVDVRKTLMRWISGEETLDLNALYELIGQAWRSALADFCELAAALSIPMLASLIVRLALPESSSIQRTIYLICRAGAVAVLAGAYAQLSAVAAELIQDVLQCSDVLAPVMISSVALSGAETTAAALTPMSAIAADLIQNLLAKWGTALCAAMAGIAIAGNLSDQIRLRRLHELLRQILQWGAGAMMTAFMGALAIQGRIGSSRDGAAARTARYAIESVVPVIGGDVSNSLESLLSTAQIIKNALGVTGLLLLLAICLTPLVKIAGMSLMLKFTSAVSEPLGDKAMTTMTGQFAEAAEMLLVVSLAAVLLCAMLTGSCMWTAGNIVR